MIATTRNQWVYIAKISKQAKRFETMLQAMNNVVTISNAQLTIQQRNLLSIASQNTITSRRLAWRTLLSLQQKQQQLGSPNLPLLKSYKNKIQNQLNKYCKDILNLIDTQLIHKANNAQSKVFYQKMKGDYYRYISEYTQGATHDTAGQNAHTAYKAVKDMITSWNGQPMQDINH